MEYEFESQKCKIKTSDAKESKKILWSWCEIKAYT